ncbi:MAG: M20/M25/M40 family metallo-hydrolase [Actinobacteria bacterium]|nr:M20/M25/M40 family metallo-hydrolase [Actinomycetota bacterium]
MVRDQPELAHEVTELLQDLIRNECVNDGSKLSGHEVRSADLLRGYFEGSGVDLETYESSPGRVSLVGRIDGRRPDAPSLLLMGHTDVVPANADGWRHDPFGAEIIDGEVWGRGAVDMLNLTSSMAVAFKRLASSGFRPDGTLIYLAVADEEALGSYGAEFLVEHHLDAVGADYVITESGGIPVPSPAGVKLPVIVGEKGCYWCMLRVRGKPGHGSQPFRTDNALVKAAEVVRRIASYEPKTQIHDVWRRFLESMGYPDDLVAPLLSAEGLRPALDDLPDAMARQFHACTHTTFAPTIVRGGSKTNTIPDLVELEIDIRTLPGQTGDDVRLMLDEALGDLSPSVELIPLVYDASSQSPADTPLWDALDRLTKRWYPGSTTVPFLTVGATDSRFFRRAGRTAYGFGLFSERLTFEDYGTMFHGDDERIDIESLVLSTELWQALARDFLVG